MQSARSPSSSYMVESHIQPQGCAIASPKNPLGDTHTELVATPHLYMLWNGALCTDSQAVQDQAW